MSYHEGFIQTYGKIVEKDLLLESMVALNQTLKPSLIKMKQMIALLPQPRDFLPKLFWDQVKLGRITPFGSRTKDPSKAESSYDISHSINDSIDTGGNFNIQLHDINPLPIERHYQRTKFARVVSRTRRTIDETDDFRPYFTYWITATQFIIMVISICLYGIGNFDVTLYERVGLVLTESLTLDQEQLFSPCMRVDESIMEEIAKDRKNEKANSGCCIRNDNSGCVQTTRDACSTLLSTFHSWTDGEGPEGRIYGPVCGQDPRFCVSPSSTAAHIWPDDISRWPICHKASRTDIGHPPHMTCELIGRPCCVGIHGKCEIRTEEYCRWVRGTFHLEANLCSQVSCLQDWRSCKPGVISDAQDNYGHIFGFISGFFLSLAFLPYTAFKLNLHRRVASVVSGVVVYILIYLSCIPLTSDFCSVQNINLKKR
ncbi:Inactive rhomboid protein 2 [Lepeophtheirus salmonis]|uniref:Inactive rhomboid protein 2 n=1 Tax=Lepeophtheirus salmonis TaxID=72036 RepID=A0A7R8HCW3_LEPSM|nr:Inactive rhomboid protein 2 [Lepeophtheirus salmonis]CAF3022818.1 Inactive rhomboid protein 2 [Lepeophtheirus salmonis]